MRQCLGCREMFPEARADPRGAFAGGRAFAGLQGQGARPRRLSVRQAGVPEKGPQEPRDRACAFSVEVPEDGVRARSSSRWNRRARMMQLIPSSENARAGAPRRQAGLRRRAGARGLHRPQGPLRVHGGVRRRRRVRRRRPRFTPIRANVPCRTSCRAAKQDARQLRSARAGCAVCAVTGHRPGGRGRK